MNHQPFNKSIGYVYCEHYSAFGRKAGIVIHRVIYDTATTLFIDNGNETYPGWRGMSLPLVVKLNRIDLESEGRAWSKSQRRYYYALPSIYADLTDGDDAIDEEPAPDFVEALGLSIPFDIEDIETAFRRKAKASHPDLGGSSEDFIQLRQVYEKARAFFDQS